MRKHRSIFAVLLFVVLTAASSSSVVRVGQQASMLPLPIGRLDSLDHEPPSTTAPSTTTTTEPATTTTTTVAPEPITEPSTEETAPPTTRARRTTTLPPATTTTVSEAPTTTVLESPTSQDVQVAEPAESSPCRTGAAFDAHACRLIEYRGDFTASEVQALVARAFPGEESKALSVAACETGRTWNRFAHNPSGARGIMQIMSSWRARFAEVTGESYDGNVFEVGPNLVFAQWLRHEGGWGNWSCH